MAVDTKRICNGTFGELWLDGDYVDRKSVV